MARLSGLDAVAVFDVLVAICGASEAHREPFIHYVTGEGYGSKEYRFGGFLGSGGKLYVTSSYVRVDCYPEDRTPNRVTAILEANEALAALDLKVKTA